MFLLAGSCKCKTQRQIIKAREGRRKEPLCISGGIRIRIWPASSWFLRKMILPPCYFASGVRVYNKSQICVHLPTSPTNAGCMVLSESRRTFASESPNSVDTKELAVVLLCCTFIKIYKKQENIFHLCSLDSERSDYK